MPCDSPTPTVLLDAPQDTNLCYEDDPVELDAALELRPQDLIPNASWT
jgi:hypothetical protein